MSSSIKAFYLKCVMNAKDLANFFETAGIAKVSNLVITKCKLLKTEATIAYVVVEYWHDTETAYNFIKMIKRDQPFDTRFIYLDTEIRAVEIKDANCCIERIRGNNAKTYLCGEQAIDEYNCDSYVIQIKQKGQYEVDQDFGGYVLEVNSNMREADFNRGNWTSLGIQQTETEYDNYMREVDFNRGNWSIISSICDMV